MDVEASNKPRFCGGDDDEGSITLKRHAACEKNTWNSEMRTLVSHEDTGYDDDDDDLPCSARLLRMSNSEICSSNCDDSVKKRPSKLPLKRPLDDSESLYISVKQSKLSLYDEDEDEDDDEDIPILQRIERSAISADKSFSVMKKYVEKELALVEKSFEECQRKRGVEEQRLQSLKRDIEECSKELGNKKMQVSCVRRINEIHKKMQGKIEECVTDLVAKEAQLYLMEDLIGERRRELKTKEIELHPVRKEEIELLQLMENIDKDRERKEGELKALSIKVAECTKKLRSKETELDAMKKLIGGQAKELESERKMLLKVMSMRNDHCAQMKDLESMKKQFEGQVKELGSKEKQCEGQVKEFESKEKHFEEQVKEFESKEKHFEEQVKEFESKKEEFEGQIKELESQKKHFESQVKELKSKEKQFEGRVEEHESKDKQLEARLKEFKSKEEQFEGQVKELESKNKHFESQVKEVKSKEKQLEGRLKVLESKEEEFNGQVKELESKREHFKTQVKELESKVKQVEGWMKVLQSKEKQLEGRVKEFQSRVEEVKELKSKNKHFECRVEDFKSKEKQLEGQGKELKPKEKQFEGQVKHRESKLNKFDGQLKDLELREKPFIKSFEEEKESGNQLSPTSNGRSLQLVASEQTDEVESLANNILVNLLASSDPSKLVLDIIQHPFIPQCEKGDNAVIIDGSHIILLEQLMRISPVVKPHVRDDAMKLALDLKAYISENTENSVAVLVFLLLLSIYGLVPSFDKDEVLKLLGFAAQHKIAVELFGTLGFADKISDFVQNLIRKQQHIEAVRFICAYNLADKYQLVGRMQN